MPFAPPTPHQLELVMAAAALLDSSKRVTLMERIAANLRRTRLPNFCARDLAMPRRACRSHICSQITDHTPFISRECIETAIDALGANDGEVGDGEGTWFAHWIVCPTEPFRPPPIPIETREEKIRLGPDAPARACTCPSQGMHMPQPGHGARGKARSRRGPFYPPSGPGSASPPPTPAAFCIWCCGALPAAARS